MGGIKRTDAQFDHALRRAVRRDSLEHGKHVNAPANAHHSQVVEETHTVSGSSGTAANVSIALDNAYEKVVAVATFDGALSPVSEAACKAHNYTTDANGNVTGVDVYYDNTTVNAHNITMKVLGVTV